MTLGTDVSTFPFDGTGRTVSGRRALAEVCLRRLITPAGSLPYDPDFGLDTRDFLNEDMGPADLRILGVRIAQELEKDERIDEVRATCTLDIAESVLRIRIRVTPIDDDTFVFTTNVGSLTAELLLEAA